MSVFTVKVNPLIGKKEWVAKPEHYDYYQEVARYLLHFITSLNYIYIR